MEKTYKMSTNAWRLFDLLTKAAENHDTIGLATICFNLGIEYDPEKYKYPSNAPAYREVWNLVEEINNSLEVDKTVHRGRHYTYRLATEAECKTDCKKLHEQALELHRRAKVLEAKINQDGQGKLLTNQNYPMNDKAKPFHEAYAEEEELCRKNEGNSQSTSSIAMVS